MEIVWHGHSCFRLRGNDAVLVTDPYEPSVGLTLPSLRASLVTVSNDHPHHNNRSAVQGSPYVISGPGEYEVSGVFVVGIGTLLPANDGDTPRLNTVYVMELDGLTLCHLGDLAQPLSSSQVDELGDVDVLFVPAGGRCTLEVPQLAELIGEMEPRVVIPMHYALAEVQVELGPLDTLLQELGIDEPQRQGRLSVTSTNLPAERRVVVLERSS